jgi:hemoglobin-like flavoprotein
VFGVHSTSEREEMIQETFRALFALCEGESWLDENLTALGLSHGEYGVTAEMYDSYCEALIDCSQEVLGAQSNPIEIDALRVAISDITRRMASATRGTRLDCSTEGCPSL